MTVFAAQAQTLTMIIPTGSGQPGNNARLLARYMTKHYPGSPETVTKIVPGANGLNAANYLYNVAPKDGLTFGSFAKTTTLAGLIGDKHAQFEPEKFIWLGSSSDSRNNPGVIVANSKYEGRELNMAEMGTTESSSVNMIRSITGWKLKRISGYKDTTEIRLAFLRKEIDAFFIQYSSLMAGNPELKGNIVLQYGNGFLRNPELKDVPTLMELAANDDIRQNFALRELTEIISRPFVLPPGTPINKVMMLRETFFKALNDPELIAEAEKMSIDISPIYWSQAEFIIKQMKSIDKETLRVLNN